MAAGCEVEKLSKTISIALPGSIINNAQNLLLKTYLAGQIARIAAVFCIDEVIVFNEESYASESQSDSEFNPNEFLCRVLQYIETPQYLRKSLFGIHPHLQYAGILNPLDAPHHMRANESCDYREGVTLSSNAEIGTLVDCGLLKNIVVNKVLNAGVRVTVHMNPRVNGNYEVVNPSTPKVQSGLYWGYTVRYAHSFGQVFTQSKYKEGYDIIIGTSENGNSVDDISVFPEGRHILIVFGGQHGLEYSLTTDKSLKVCDAKMLFHYYLNTCPNQGSRTIRTEEAIVISLSALRPKL